VGRRGAAPPRRHRRDQLLLLRLRPDHANPAGSTGAPGPIVLETVLDRMWWPFAAAGLARTIASRKARRFSSSCSTVNDFLPAAACTMPLLSTRNSILPAFNSLTARATSIVTVPAFGLGMRPRGPSTLPRGPSWPI